MSKTHVLAVDLSSDSDEPVWIAVNRPHVELPEHPVRTNDIREVPMLSDWSLEPLYEPESVEKPAEVETVETQAPAAQERAQPVWLLVWIGILFLLLLSGGYLVQKYYNHITFGS